MRRHALAITGAALTLLLTLPGASMAAATTAKACPKGHLTMRVHGKLVKCAPTKAKPTACPKGHLTMRVHGKLVKCAPVKPKPRAKPSAKPTPSTPVTPTPSAIAVPPLGSVISIAGFAFSSISVKAGSTVTVRNGDSVEHTLTIAAASIDVDVVAGGTATFVAPATPGTYALTCDFHHAMRGSLVVIA